MAELEYLARRGEFTAEALIDAIMEQLTRFWTRLARLPRNRLCCNIFGRRYIRTAAKSG